MIHYLHGLHASSWIDGITPPSTKFPGWLTFTEIAGGEGGDYRRWADAGHGIIVRLNNGYYPNGTIPAAEGYDAFATRCAAFVDHSQGCHVWIIGNEPNHKQERPGGIPIQPEQYAACFLMCYAAIKQAHPDHLVLAAPIAPYNAQTGDCLAYLGRVAQRLASAGAVDGWAIHAYTRAHDPALIVREEIVNGWQWHFRTYRDQLAVLGKHALDVPVFLTEYNPTDGWANEDRGYIHEALCEVDAWNQANPRQVIRACCAFRWHDPSRPGWTIRDKPGVVADYCRAADVGYTCDTWDNGDEEDPVTIIQDGFENGFTPYQGIGELTVPAGWVPTWVQGTEPGVLVRIEVQKAGAAQTRSGTGAVAIHSRSATIDGALYRRMSPVAIGSDVVASVWCLKTEGAMGHGMQIGIDPTGGTDHTASRVVWSSWYSEYASDYAINAWRLRVVNTTAQAEQITVFLRSKLDFAADRSHAHFDDVTVEVTEPATPPVPPTPGGEHTLTMVLLVDGEEVARQEVPIRATMTLEIGGLQPKLQTIWGRFMALFR